MDVSQENISLSEIMVDLDELKLFGKWSYRDIVILDPSLKKYISH